MTRKERNNSEERTEERRRGRIGENRQKTLIGIIFVVAIFNNRHIRYFTFHYFVFIIFQTTTRLDRKRLKKPE